MILCQFVNNEMHDMELYYRIRPIEYRQLGKILELSVLFHGLQQMIIVWERSLSSGIYNTIYLESISSY